MKKAVLLAACVVGSLAWAGLRPAHADARDDAAGLAAFRTGAFAEAYQDWTSSAQTGDPRAARLVGGLYDTGEGVHQDRAEALRWYKRAAALGDAAAMFNIAVSYDSGTGATQDRAEAARWYARAAALHHGRAEYNLALMDESGDGVRRNPEAARRLFQAAARDGIGAAAAHIPPAQHVAVRSTPAGEDTTFFQAQRDLLSRTPQDAASAVALFRQAASRNDAAAPMAQYDLAWCYENGIGVAVDRRQAHALYVGAAAATREASLHDLADSGARGTQAPGGASGATGAVPASRPEGPGR